MSQSFVIIMPIGGEYVNINFRLKNFIDETVFLRDGPAPLPTAVTLQRFRMACTCPRVIYQFVEQFNSFLKGCWFTATQLGQILLCFLRVNDVIHVQSELSQAFISSGLEKRFPLPCLISSRASSTRAKNSSFVISVGSASLSFTNLRRYLATRLSMVSLSARVLKLRNISAFNAPVCAAVITLVI